MGVCLQTSNTGFSGIKRVDSLGIHDHNMVKTTINILPYVRHDATSEYDTNILKNRQFGLTCDLLGQIIVLLDDE